MSQASGLQPNDYLVIQTNILMLLVEALIASHPNPGEVRRLFDQLYGQIQADLLVSGAALPEHLEVAHRLIEKVFSPT